MLTKAQGKYIRSLAGAEGRREAGAFMIEGPKLLAEWAAAAPESILQVIAAEGSWKPPAKVPGERIATVRASELAALSSLKTPPPVLAVCRLPPRPTPAAGGWTIVAENLQDPGNLGALLRIADWYDIGQVWTTAGAADFYNPKVVQAAMGAHLRVRMITGDVFSFLQQTRLPVFAATLSGENLRTILPVPEGILLIGNESKGLSDAMCQCATRQVTIPRRGGAESLNAAVAAGILCDRLRA